MSIVYPVFVASAIYEMYEQVAVHKHHPDAHPLDSDIAQLAKEKLGIDTKGIQIVDDLNCGELSKSWSMRFTTPVIAIQRGLKELAPNARKYLIMKELHLATGGNAWVALALKVAQSVIICGIVTSGGGFLITCAKILCVAALSALIEGLANSFFAGQAHEFACKDLSDGEKNEIMRTDKAMNEYCRSQGESEDTEPFVTYLKSQPNQKYSALDLPFKLKPAGTIDGFYQAREAHHLTNRQEKVELMKTTTLMCTLFSFIVFRRVLPPQVPLLVPIVLTRHAIEPMVAYDVHYSDDKEFLKGRTDRPATIDPTVWKGAL